MFGKKGQAVDGRSIASLILVIAILIILYVLFIPVEDRRALLNSGNESTLLGSSSGKIELLSESPGLVSPSRGFGVVHQFPSVNIFVKNEPKVLPLAQSLRVKNSLFSKSFPRTSFETADSDLKKVVLAFSVNEPSGELRIFINNNQFYADEVRNSGVKVVEIPLNLIKEENVLSFEVSSPGLAFWKTNEYALADITLKEEFERIHAEESRQFTLTAEEKKSLQSAELSYFQYCNLALPDQTTALKVYVNDESVFSGLLRCISTKQTLELDKSKMFVGVNTLRFLLEKGDFTFNELKVETQSKLVQNPTYLFSLSKAQFDKVKAGNSSLELQLLLEDEKVSKRARILVNDGEIILNTDQNSLKRSLKDYIVEGTNFIKIVPGNSFTIVGLKVVLG